MLRKAAWFALALSMGAAAPTLASGKVALVSSDPAQGATAQKVSAVTLRFDGPVTAASAGADVTMTSMPGMTDHPPMVIKAFTIEPGKTPESLVMKLKKPLVPGTYEVGYSVVGADGERLDGTVSFTVAR